jgi:hypothetical protein
MLVTLTYYGNGKKTIVNFDEVKTIYEVFNKEENCPTTKILFKGSTLRMEDFINVSESVEEIHNIINELRENGSQVVDFSQNVKQVIREGYDRFRRERTYNRENVLDDNRWNS